MKYEDTKKVIVHYGDWEGKVILERYVPAEGYKPSENSTTKDFLEHLDKSKDLHEKTRIKDAEALAKKLAEYKEQGYAIEFNAEYLQIGED